MKWSHLVSDKGWNCKWEERNIDGFLEYLIHFEVRLILLKGRRERRCGRESAHVRVCALRVGILREIFGNVTTGCDHDCRHKEPNDLYDRHKKREKRSSSITKARRDQMLSVTQLTLFQLYTRQGLYITRYKRMLLLWALCICTRCSFKVAYMTESFICQYSIFWKQLFSVVNSLCYMERWTVIFFCCLTLQRKRNKIKVQNDLSNLLDRY